MANTEPIATLSGADAALDADEGAADAVEVAAEGAGNALAAVGKVDLELAALAREKLLRKETLQREEVRALNRVRKAEDEALAWQHYRRCPIKHVLVMTGRPRAQLDAQSVRYGIPFSGVDGVVDLSAVIRAIIEFFSKHHDAIAVALRDTADGSVRAQLKQVELEKKKAELAEKLGKLIPVETAAEIVTELLGEIRRAMQDLARDVGEDRLQQVHERLDSAKAAMLKRFGG